MSTCDFETFVHASLGCHSVLYLNHGGYNIALSVSRCICLWSAHLFAELETPHTGAYVLKPRTEVARAEVRLETPD